LEAYNSKDIEKKKKRKEGSRKKNDNRPNWADPAQLSRSGQPSRPSQSCSWSSSFPFTFQAGTLHQQWLYLSLFNFPSMVWPFILNFNAKVTPFSMVNPFRELFLQFIVLIVETDVVHRMPLVDI
jgi:hypothetical protein